LPDAALEGEGLALLVVGVLAVAHDLIMRDADCNARVSGVVREGLALSCGDSEVIRSPGGRSPLEGIWKLLVGPRPATTFAAPHLRATTEPLIARSSCHNSCHGRTYRLPMIRSHSPRRGGAASGGGALAGGTAGAGGVAGTRRCGGIDIGARCCSRRRARSAAAGRRPSPPVGPQPRLPLHEMNAGWVTKRRPGHAVRTPERPWPLTLTGRTRGKWARLRGTLARSGPSR
jgi:hypothetical protein